MNAPTAPPSEPGISIEAQIEAVVTMIALVPDPCVPTQEGWRAVPDQLRAAAATLRTCSPPDDAEVQWLLKFINCSAFAPPPEEIAHAHALLESQARALAAAKQDADFWRDMNGRNVRYAEKAQADLAAARLDLERAREDHKSIAAAAEAYQKEALKAREQCDNLRKDLADAKR